MDKRFKQAVILAGGKGSRLGDLTRNRPKPMAEVSGVPFLSHLLTLLSTQGIERVLLLTGYLGEVIHEYVGNGAKWGLEVSYSHTSVEDGTGRRLAFASDQLDAQFLLMYADVFWPIQLEKMAETFQLYPESVAMVAAYVNRDELTTNNLGVDEAGFVRLYDKSRKASGRTHVDSGYLLCRKEILEYFPEGNFSLERCVYPLLVQEGRMIAFPSEQRHYSIDTVQKISVAEQFFRSGKTVFLDRDGTINRSSPKREYICSWDAFEFLDGAIDGIRLLKENGYRVVIVSNQAGIARGMLTHDDVIEIHTRMQSVCSDAGAHFDGFYYCSHGWDEGCCCRKPSPGLLYKAANEMAFDLSQAVMIGDMESDIQAAERAGIPGIQVGETYTLLDACRNLVESDFQRTESKSVECPGASDP